MHRPRRLCLGGDRAYLVDSILDIGSDIGRKDRASVHGLRHRLLPSSQQTLHGLTSSLVHDKIGVHEGTIQVTSEVHSVGSTDVLDYGIENIERWKLPFWTCLAHVSHSHDRRECMGASVVSMNLLFECGSRARSKWPAHTLCSPWR